MVSLSLLVAEMEDKTVLDILESILDRTGYLAQLEESTDPQDQARAENIGESLSVAKDFQDTNQLVQWKTSWNK